MVTWEKEVIGIGGDRVREMKRFLDGSCGRGGKERERERSGSLGKMEEMLKRKREEMERSREIVRKRVGPIKAGEEKKAEDL